MSVSKQIIHLQDLYFEQKIWVNELQFYKDEVKLFEKRLTELVNKNTGQEMLIQLERFQNKFIREKEVIDTLRHDIKAHENELEDFARTHDEIAIEHTRFTDHSDLREEFTTFKKLYAELKEEFMRFLVRWM